MKVEHDFDLTNSNSYRIKSTCKRAFIPSCEEDFIVIYEDKSTTRKCLLGGGFNVILSKSYYDDDFIISISRLSFADSPRH